MKHKTLVLSAILLAALFAAACDWLDLPVDSNVFESRLRGTWEPDDSSVYSGTLKIENDLITISGFSEAQKPTLGGDDSQRPFKGFTKNYALKGYSEKGDTDGEGIIYIEDIGILQTLPYRYSEVSSGLTKTQFLRFDFGGRPQTFVKTAQ